MTPSAVDTLPSVQLPATVIKPVAARAGAYTLLLAAVLVVFMFELTIGAVRIPLTDVLSILTGGQAERVTWTRIVLSFRFPRALNALVSAAAAGAIAVLLLMLSVSRRVTTVTLLIVGLLIGYVCIGLISALLHFVDEVQARAFEQWEGGSFDGITRQQLTILIPLICAGIAAAHLMVKRLNALLLGETYAASMGVSVARARLLAFACVGLLAGPVTAFCGAIPFLGLVAAHVARGLMQTSDHRILMPAAALLGSVLALTTDLVIHLPWAKHFLHLDAVIGMIGAPVALWVILRRRHMRALEV
jgi:iron complex transport system permease protein